MTISKKLSVGFAVVLVIAAAVGFVGITGMQSLRESGTYMYEKRVRGLMHVHGAVTSFNRMRFDARRIVINSFYDDRKGATDNMESFESEVKKFVMFMEESREIATTDGLLEFHDRILELLNEEYLPKIREINHWAIYDIPDHHNRLYLNVLMAAATDVTVRMDDLLIGLVALNAALARQADVDNAWLTRRHVIMLVSLLSAAVIGIAVVAFFIIRSIARPINESSGVLREIARGNFKARMKGDYRDDFKTIKDSVNDTAMRLSAYLDEKMEAERAARESDLAKARVEAAAEAVMAGISYASHIQRNILPLDSALGEAFADHSVIWKPRDVVGGDIYWMKRFGKGTVLCVCDCTGHGTPGALLTTLVVSALEAVVLLGNCHDTADIIWQLEQRLVDVFSVNSKARDADDSNIMDGCDIAVLFIEKNGCVTLSSGHTNVFVCDGEKVTRFRGQNIYVGEGKLKNRYSVDTTYIPADPRNRFHIATDGLFDQPGGASRLPFGYKRFERLILENHGRALRDVSDAIWTAFEEYRGDEARVDDFELVTFKP